MGSITLNPFENIYVIESAADLPDVLSKYVLYNCQYDAGDGIGMYYTSDGAALLRLDSPTIVGLGPWRHRTETATPPANGQIRFDNADPTAASNLYIAETNDDSTDMGAFLALLAAGDLLYIQEKGDKDNYFLIAVSSNTDSGTYKTLGISSIILVGDEPSQNAKVIVVT